MIKFYMSGIDFKNNRLSYLDALRGISMILVVFSHIMLFAGFPTNSSFFGALCQSVMLPLFFFISGFFSYKLLQKWNTETIISSIRQKFVTQILGMLFFYVIFQLVMHKSIIEFISDGFVWFWYTIALFQMFLIYITTVIIFRNLRHGNILINIVLASITLLITLKRVAYPTVSSSLAIALEWFYISDYLQFFVLGIFCRQFFNLVEKVIKIDFVKSTIILSYLLSLLCVYGISADLKSFNSAMFNFIEMFIMRYSGVGAVFILFYSQQQFFNSDSKSSSILKLVGRRTLDIYMMHIFFMPSLHWLGELWHNETNMFLFQAIASCIIAAADISLCLLTGLLLRSSNFLSYWLFGVKNTRSLNIP